MVGDDKNACWEIYKRGYNTIWIVVCCGHLMSRAVKPNTFWRPTRWWAISFPSMKASHLCPREQETKAICPIGNPFYVTSLFVHRLAISKFKLEVKAWNPQFRSKVTIFVPCDLKFDRCLWKNGTLFLWHLKLCAPFRSHLKIRAGVIVRKFPNRGKICFVFSGFDLWPMTFSIDIMVITPENVMM